MNTVEFVKQICKERRIPLSKIERELGFANGYIGQLKKGSFPSDRLYKIADYLGESPEYLASCGELTRPASSVPALSDSESSLLLYFRKLDLFDQAKVVGFIEGLLANEKYIKTSTKTGAESA